MRGVNLSQWCDKSAQRLSQGCAEGREINQKCADASENNENPCGGWTCRNDATKVHRGCRKDARREERLIKNAAVALIVPMAKRPNSLFCASTPRGGFFESLHPRCPRDAFEITPRCPLLHVQKVLIFWYLRIGIFEGFCLNSTVVINLENKHR